MTIKRKHSLNLKHLITVGSLLIIVAVAAASLIAPDSIVFSLADNSMSATILRIAVSVTLISILASKPPRSLKFRVALGTMSTLVIGVALAGMTSYHLGMIDAVGYLLVSIIFALEALEDQSSMAIEPKSRPIRSA